MTLLGMVLLVHKKVINSIKEITPISNRLITARLQCANRKYTLINAHAHTNISNKKNPNEAEKFLNRLGKAMGKIPKEDTIILLGDFNAQLGREKEYRYTVGTNSPTQMGGD